MTQLPNLIGVTEIQTICKLRSKAQAYEVIRGLPVGMVVHLGRRVRVNADRLAEWLNRGGSQ